MKDNRDSTLLTKSLKLFEEGGEYFFDYVGIYEGQYKTWELHIPRIKIGINKGFNLVELDTNEYCAEGYGITKQILTSANVVFNSQKEFELAPTEGEDCHLYTVKILEERAEDVSLEELIKEAERSRGHKINVLIGGQDGKKKS